MTTMVADRPQHMVALRRANEIRIGGAMRLEEIRQMPRHRAFVAASRILLHDTNQEVAGSIKLDLLLRSIPYVGHGAVHRFAEEARINPRRLRRRLRDLTERERTALAGVLHERGRRTR